MSTPLLYRLDPWVVAVILTVALIAVAEIGYEVAVRTASRGADVSQFQSIQGAPFTILALLLGFTFGAASLRYDARRMQVVDEANAMGTAYLRTQTLPEPYRTQAADLIRGYVDVQLAYFSIAHQDQLTDLVRRTGELQKRLWSVTTDVATANPDSVVVGLYEASVNQVIDMQAKRLEVFLNRVPETIWGILFLIALVTFLALGYLAGLRGHRSLLIRTTAAIIVALVMVMILDLDRPLVGPSRVSPQPLIDLRENIR